MIGTVKRAISLPKEQDEKLRKIAQKRHAPFSTLIQVAVQAFLEREDRDQMIEAYKSYYADKDNERRMLSAVSDSDQLSHKAWP